MNSAAPRFDRWQFDGNFHQQKAASARTGLSFQDDSGMSVQTRRQSGERRLNTPDWAASDLLLRELLVAFLENRVGIRTPHGTLQERRERAELKAVALRPKLEDRLDMLTARYVEKLRNGVPHGRLKRLAVNIENLDTYLRYTKRNAGLDTLAACAYLFYRAMFDSVGVGIQTRLKLTHVRGLLMRMNHVWKLRFKDGRFVAGRPYVNEVRKWERREEMNLVDRAHAMHAQGLAYSEIARHLGMDFTSV